MTLTIRICRNCFKSFHKDCVDCDCPCNVNYAPEVADNWISSVLEVDS